MRNVWIIALSALVIAGCKKNDPTPTKKKTQLTKKSTSRPASSRPAKTNTRAKKGPPSVVAPQGWIDQRVAKAKARLHKTNAGKLIWQAIEAHGGLKHWFQKGALAFHFAYKPLEGRARESSQTIELWSVKAHHVLTANKDVTFGWDGKQAWLHPKDAKTKLRIRFWSLTPFYFVGVPFVFADPGIILKQLGPITFEGKTYDQVKVTYKPGTGDAPDDFYVVYIEKKTKRVGGVRYIVSYPGFFPKGKHSPEKFMAYDGQQDIDGIKFPKTFRTFKWNKKKPGKLVTRSYMTKVSFRPTLQPSFFVPPKQAKLLKALK